MHQEENRLHYVLGRANIEREVRRVGDGGDDDDDGGGGDGYEAVKLNVLP